MLDLIAQTLFDKKASNIVALDVRGVNSTTDYFVVAEGNAGPHLRSLADALVEKLAKSGHELLRVEGKGASNWTVLDFGDVIIHLFSSEFREKYQLERLWSDGKIVNLNIDVGGGRR